MGSISNDRSTLGSIQPHTEAKHDILRYHLGAWFQILGSTFPRLQYIDGFAGPGEYEGAEPGSPIIVLREVALHPYLQQFAAADKQIDFLFVDNNTDYISHLRGKVFGCHWPRAFNITIDHREFEVVLGELLDAVAAGEREMPPTLAFIDPFGPSGFSMDLLTRLAGYDRIDVLINLNITEFIRWILPDSTKHVTADRLFGGKRWRPALTLEGRERINFLVNEYENALREIKWRGTNFEMINTNNQTQYFLVFATGSPKGMEVIKRAMRRVSPDGLFRYSDRTDPNQPRLLGMTAAEEYPQELANSLFRKYDGREVPKREIIDEDIAWHPRWLETDLTAGLRLLEDSVPSRIRDVTVPRGTRRKGSFPDECVIAFGLSGQLPLG